MGCHPGSLQQKCDPDKYPQNSNNNRLCFPSHQTFSIFAPLVVPWGHILDPRGGSVMLACICKIQLHIAFVFFYTSDMFHSRSFGYPLGSHPGSLLQTYCPGKYSQNSSKRCLRVLPIRHFPFWLLLVDPWDPILRSCGKSVMLTSTCAIQLKVVYGFLPIRRFPFSLI